MLSSVAPFSLIMKLVVIVAKNKGGRPPKEIDKKQFENLCKLQCTLTEMCAFFDCDDMTLNSWCKKTYNKSFSETFALKKGMGNISLRRTQFQLAEDNVAMAIWLGKQRLGQSDNPVNTAGDSTQGYSFIPACEIGSSFVDIYRDILNRKHRFYEFKGGRGSLKSSFCALAVIDEVMRNRNYCAIALRQVKDTLRESVYANLTGAIDKLGLTEQFECTVNPMKIKKISTGQFIYFRGCDDPVKIKSIKPPNGMYIGVIWFEEKDQLHGSEAVRSIQQSVMRGGDDIIVLSSYNTPISTQHFLNQNELLNTDSKIIYHHSYYCEAPPEWLGQPFIEEAGKLKQTNEKAYRHEYLGEAVGTGGTVFENVKVRCITAGEHKSFDRFYYGVDWGFYPDPFAFVKCAYNADKRILYILDEQVEYKKNNRDTADILLNEKKLTRDDLIICDSAEPKSIADYQEYNLYAIGAEKGAGSVNYSMKWLQGMTEIVIDAKCRHTAKEFLEYEYERTRDNEIISGYPDKNNHCIDAVRYALNYQWRRSGA